MFVTLAYSGNNNYYGLTGEEIARIMKKNKIQYLKWHWMHTVKILVKIIMYQ